MSQPSYSGSGKCIEFHLQRCTFFLLFCSALHSHFYKQLPGEGGCVLLFLLYPYVLVPRALVLEDEIWNASGIEMGVLITTAAALEVEAVGSR